MHFRSPKSQITNHKNQIKKPKSQIPNYKSKVPEREYFWIKLNQLEKEPKVFDLEDRTALFAKRIRDFCLKLPKNAANFEYIPQLLRSGSSPGANYIEANESIGAKDFKMKIKTCRRESKESSYWLRLVITDESPEQEKERTYLQNEANELKLIFNSILMKTT